jgi:hypothetical protein
MGVNPPVVPDLQQYQVGDIIIDSFIEIGACPPGEEPSADEMQWGLRKINYLVDVWQALQFYVYSYLYSVYPLQAGLSPHTIGPAAGATFATPGVPRPVRIVGATQLQNAGSTQVDLPINTSRDRAWWMANQTKAIQTDVVTDLYYDATSPNGSLFFWPVPNVAAQVRLQIWNAIQQFLQITDPIGGPGGPGTLPPAYRAALMLTLAEMLLPAAKRDAHPQLVKAAREARFAVFGNNVKSPRMRTQDSGMPKAGAKGTRGDFNWITGGRAGGPPE